MPNPADLRPPHKTSKALAGMTALACVACCALPALIAAGVLGAGAGATVDMLIFARWQWPGGRRRRTDPVHCGSP
ncbi:hypothetical protein ACFU5O_18020 [Streptomyces sp. NPDC057445]|uniref:hypothetical protein n=1 Tax=Streptomyces sp. NPDC057445 TaxID=3346136 RepID=UPI0036AFC129